MNSDHTSLSISKQLSEEGLFKGSEKIQVKLVAKPFSSPLKYQKWKVAYRFDLHVNCTRVIVGKHKVYKFGSSQACVEFLPNPSLGEIMEELGGDYETRYDCNTAICQKVCNIDYLEIQKITRGDTRQDAAALMCLKLRGELEDG